MTRTGGDKTRKKILETAEKLFAKHGFDATSVDLIAQTAGVNKALIYYYFKNKNDLVLNLLKAIIDEAAERSLKGVPPLPSREEMIERREIENEVEFLASKKRILSVMMSEALRSNQRDDFLFRCAEIVIRQEHRSSQMTSSRMVHEFFTGFIPLISFVVLRDKLCAYFGYSKDQVTEDFLSAFEKTHLRSKTKNK